MIYISFLFGLFSGFCFGYRIGINKCDHIWGWLRNTHGDEINHCNYRTVFKCEKCNKLKYIPDYITKGMAIHIHSSVSLNDIQA